jgi:hypothetical protein
MVGTSSGGLYICWPSFHTDSLGLGGSRPARPPEKRVPVVIVESLKKLREEGLEALRELRVREMEHHERARELEVAFQRERARAGAAAGADHAPAR